MSSDFVASTPGKAREEITRLREIPWLTAQDRAILDRLASDPAMNELWSKLPDTENIVGDVIRHAADSARVALAQRAPFPKRGNAAKEKYILETVKRGPNCTLENVAASALMLRESMIATQKLMLSIYPELKLDELLAQVDYIESLYKAAHEQNAQYWRQFHCPHIRTASAKDAKQICFSKMMSRYFKEQFGQPLDAVVAALTQAVFNLKEGVSEETIRKRRRDGR